MDVHQTSTTLAVVGPSGRRVGSQVVETNEQALLEAIRAMPKPRHVCFEEGTLSALLCEVLSPHVDELLVAGINVSRGPKSDVRDAFGLADALRLRAIAKPVLLTQGTEPNPAKLTLARKIAATVEG